MERKLIPVRDFQTGRMQYIDTASNTIQMTDNAGRLVKMDLGYGDVHIDRGLANIAMGFKLAEGIADKACPVVGTPNASDKYWIWDKDDALQPAQNLLVAPGGSVTEVSPRLSNASFATVPYALQAFIPTELEANADSPLRIRASAMNRLMNALLIGRETRVAAILKLAGNYAAGFKVSLGATAKWNGGSASNPVQDLFTRIEAALMPITDIFMSERTWHDFVQNSQVQKYIASKINVPGIPTADQITGGLALLGLPPIHIGAMKAKGATGTYDYVWGDDVVLAHIPRGAPSDGQDISTAYTYRWSGGTTPQGQTMQGGWYVRSYFDEKRGPQGGTVIIVGHYDAEVFTSDAVSGLITGAHQ